MFNPRSPSSRRLAQWCAAALLSTGAILAFAAPALASTPAPASAPSVSIAQSRPLDRVNQQSRPAAIVTPVTPATLESRVSLKEPGGVCQVPGIGDIGGLVGLCAAGSSGIIGDLNNICQPSVPQPEQATGGLNSMIEPPQSAAGGKTLYDNYGVAGQYWAAHDMQCSDMTSLVGNNVAGMVFDAAKAMDRVTITVYQSAAGDNILTWLRNAVDRLISALGNAIYFPYLAPVVLLGAVWLAWQGLVRKRATRTIEGTLWMVVAATAAIALIGKPADFTGVGSTVSNGVTQVLNTAFAKLPSPGGSDCLPVQAGDRQSVTANYNFASGNGLVDQNADELWSVLVCKPWLYGELGTTQFATTGNGPQTVVNQYGRQLIWAQAIASNETPSTALITAKQDTYSGIAAQIKANNPGIYPLFQGNQWTTRLEIAFAAIFAALVAGLLILLIALTLIVLKLGFLLLLVAGPFFLIIGTHPGFGRIIAIRWFEMLVGVLMKQVAIAMVLSVLLYCYSLIMGTADTVLPWALKILMIALVTVTVFIYRKPFQHLFSAVGYGTIGSQERSDISLREASDSFRRSTVSAASVIPGYRAARWARRNPGQAAEPPLPRPVPEAEPSKAPSRPEPRRAPPMRAACGPTRRPRPTVRAMAQGRTADGPRLAAGAPREPGPRRRRRTPAAAPRPRSNCPREAAPAQAAGPAPVPADQVPAGLWVAPPVACPARPAWPAGPAGLLVAALAAWPAARAGWSAAVPAACPAAGPVPAALAGSRVAAPVPAAWPVAVAADRAASSAAGGAAAGGAALVPAAGRALADPARAGRVRAVPAAGRGLAGRGLGCSAAGLVPRRPGGRAARGAPRRGPVPDPRRAGERLRRCPAAAGPGRLRGRAPDRPVPAAG